MPHRSEGRMPKPAEGRKSGQSFRELGQKLPCVGKALNVAVRLVALKFCSLCFPGLKAELWGE